MSETLTYVLARMTLPHVIAFAVGLFFAHRMRNVFGPDRCIEDIACLQHRRALLARFAVTHFNPAVENGEHFLAVVDVPFVGLIRPVQPRSDATHVGDIECAPWTLSRKCPAADNLHDEYANRIAHADRVPHGMLQCT